MEINPQFEDIHALYEFIAHKLTSNHDLSNLGLDIDLITAALV